MPFIVHCPYCQSPMTVPDHLAGTAATCAHCRQAIRLPAGPAVAAGGTQAAPEAAPEAAVIVPPSKRRRTRVPAWAAVLLVLAAAGLVASGVGLVRWGAARGAPKRASGSTASQPAPTIAGSADTGVSAGGGTHPFTIAVESAEPIRADSEGTPISGPQKLLWERRPGGAIDKVKERFRVTIAAKGVEHTVEVTENGEGEQVHGDRGERAMAAYHALLVVEMARVGGVTPIGRPFSGKGTVEVELVTGGDEATARGGNVFIAGVHGSYRFTRADEGGTKPTVVSNTLTIPLVVAERGGGATTPSAAGAGGLETHAEGPKARGDAVLKLVTNGSRDLRASARAAGGALKQLLGSSDSQGFAIGFVESSLSKQVKGDSFVAGQVTDVAALEAELGPPDSKVEGTTYQAQDVRALVKQTYVWGDVEVGTDGKGKIVHLSVPCD